MNLNVDARYEIEVTINGGQHIVKGETKLIDGIYIKSPANSLPFVDLKNYRGDSPYEYNNGDNAKIFQMTLRFNYLEVKDGDTSYYSISWPQAKKIRPRKLLKSLVVNFLFLHSIIYLWLRFLQQKQE
jgi:hypothetical protein